MADELIEVINTSTTPRDLSTGQVLAPGERGRVPGLTEHEQAQIDGGYLRALKQQQTGESDERATVPRQKEKR